MVYIDTNVLLDILLHRNGNIYAADALIEATNRNQELAVSATAFTDICYILRKNLKDSKKVLNLATELSKIVVFLPTTDKEIQFSLTAGWEDIEDSIVYATAKEAKCIAIITNNIMDFKKSEIPVYTPEEYVRDTNI